MESTTDATDNASANTTPSHPKTRLLPSLLLAAAAIAGALVFASNFETAPPLSVTQPADTTSSPHVGHHHGHQHGGGHGHAQGDPDAEAGPRYFAGGLWSQRLGLAGLAEAGVDVMYPGKRVTIHSLSWHDGLLSVIDRSPLKMESSEGAAASDLVIVSIDHAGGDPSPAFAGAIQKHLETLGDEQDVLIVTPLPGPDKRGKNEFPYDWTFLQANDKIGLVHWLDIQPEADLNARPLTGYLKAWVKQAADAIQPPEQSDATTLIVELDVLAEPEARARQTWLIVTRSPYEMVRAIESRLPRELWAHLNPDATTKQAAGISIQQALMYMRAMGVAADSLIKAAAESEDPVLRAMAARAIGDLADLTTDPLSILTPLAEDPEMRVRYEALVASRALPGRRAAGVTQLAENMEMSESMRALFDATMPMMLAYGEPVPADSRADRLRRMAMAELLQEQRDALVCRVLLERADLPDDQIDPVLKQLAEINGAGPLVTLLNLLETINPRFLREREVLMRRLVGWPTNELDAQQDRLVELAKTGRLAELRAAAVAAMMNSADPQAVVKAVGQDPVMFAGLAWIENADLLGRWAPITLDRALSTAGDGEALQVAALDALLHLPDDTLTPQRIDSLLLLARNADGLDLRFAGIRAVNALPPGKQPENIDDLKLTRLTVEAVPGGIRYNKTQLTAIAGRPVELTLINPDSMAHNLAITKPGRGQPVGMAVTALGSLAAENDYIPEGSADVLFHTGMLGPGESETLRFIAPTAPGKYDYVCTFPGHFTTMIGVLEVVAP